MNTSIVYIGMDVHTTSYSLCTFSTDIGAIEHETRISPDIRELIKYVEKIRSLYPDASKVVCGYEAGCLGYSLYNKLTEKGIDCVILAPSTMATIPGKRIKTDKRDASNIAKCMAYNTYSAVYVPDEEDVQVKEFIRMMDGHVYSLKKIKQQILAMVTRLGFLYNTEGGNRGYWTARHISWLKGLKLSAMDREALDEYLITYDQLTEKIERFKKRVEETAAKDRYRENVMKLRCFCGIETRTALSLIVEIGDFKRFENAQKFSAFLGLVPGESSSGVHRNTGGITKAGNTHLRKLLTESAQCYSRGIPGTKSKTIVKKQEGNPPKVIAYSDRANERLKRKYYRMTMSGKNHNVVISAIARELACFIWGMMNDCMDPVS